MLFSKIFIVEKIFGEISSINVLLINFTVKNDDYGKQIFIRI
jgi:hypothetical protein